MKNYLFKSYLYGKSAALAFALVFILAGSAWAQYVGTAEQAFQASQNPQNKAVAKKVFCYCGCDKEAGHRDLWDCYRTKHFVSCGTCQQEMLRIQQMNAQNEPFSRMRSTIDHEFSSSYPFQNPSPILQRYLAGEGRSHL